MRRYGIFLSMFAACVMAGSVSNAVGIDNGSGGKVYLYGVWPDSTTTIFSFELTPDWQPRFSWSAPVMPVTSHGVYTNSDGSVSPEVLVSNPTGYADLLNVRTLTGAVTARKTTPLGGNANTDAMLFSIPQVSNADWILKDPTGQFTGSTSSYFLQSGTAQYISDSSGNLSGLGSGKALTTDLELAGNRVYGISNDGTHDQIVYYEKTGGGYSTLKTFFTQGLPTERLTFYADHGIAAGTVKGPQGQDVPAVWAGMEAAWPNGRVALLRDLDGDGDADNVTPGELKILAMYPDQSTNYPQTVTPDIELITGLDGKKFLIMIDSAWAGLVQVCELLDNGDFMPGTFFSVGNWDQFAGHVTSFEVDFPTPAAIPEPMTLLLVGTGVLGVSGWMRRRRMR